MHPKSLPKGIPRGNPWGRKEGFAVQNSLNISPQFIKGKTTEQIQIDNEMSKTNKPFDPSTFDPKSASIDDVKKYTKYEVSKTFKDVLGPINKTISSTQNLYSNDLNESNATISEDIAEMEDMGIDSLADSMSNDPQAKCNFTTMEQSGGYGYNKSNRMVFQPSGTNTLLPSSNVLNNEVYSTGLNGSKSLTNRYSNYN